MATIKVVNKKIFDTDEALNASFDGMCGKWQILTYSFFVFSYAIIIGWINHLLEYSLLSPKSVRCDYSGVLEKYNYSNQSIIQRLSGKDKYIIYDDNNQTTPFSYEHSNEFGQTVVTDYNIYCDIKHFLKLPRFTNFIGFVMGCLLLGFASDKGGRKIIILACIWTAGVMSLFQLVGHDFISFAFFQFFLGLFIGGIQASFLPAIIEMFPTHLRAFYGVFFHLIICLFELLLPWLSKSFKSWKLLQIFITAPVAITAVLQWFVYESIFWYLAHKEYDKVINMLTKISKRNNIDFLSKFKQANDFLHAKHSKAVQVDFLPLLRLQDVELLGKKYPQVDMVELQKQKANSSKFRRFLNSLKGESYRSTNTIYRPFDFIYSPTLLSYVLILGGLWFTNGLTDSMEIKSIKDTIRKSDDEEMDFYLQKTISNLTCVLSSTIAIVFALFKFGRRWLIFSAYLIIEICLLGSLIAEYSSKDDEQTKVALVVLYHFCKFSTHFGFIFLILITAELFPTSLRCTGVGICFILKAFGSLISSPDLLNYNLIMHRLAYCLLTLFFGSMTLFLPETKDFPLPRCILHIEAMQTTIGKKLRSRKVQLACEKRQIQLAETNSLDRNNNNELHQQQQQRLLETYPSHLSNTNSFNQNLNIELLKSNKSYGDAGEPPVRSRSTSQSGPASQSSNQNPSNSNRANELLSSSKNQTNEKDPTNKQYPGAYDTVTSVHDIEQDDHIYYRDIKESQQTQNSQNNSQPLLINFEKNKLTKILEVPSKNITRNNSIADGIELANSKL